MASTIKWTGRLEDDLWERHLARPGRSTKKLAQDMDLPFKAVDNALYRLKATRQEHWMDQARLGFFDIETSNLYANVGYMLSWGLMLTDGTIFGDSITRREIMSDALEPDYRVVKSCMDTIKKNVDCVVTFNGDRFDLPFLWSRTQKLGIWYPGYGEKLHLDLYWQARKHFRTTNKRLGTLSEFLEMAPKDHYDVTVWNRARRGSEAALQHIYDHCIADLHITQDLLIALGPYAKWTRRSM